jgi:sugar phosphate isomerase/epimerase
MNRKIFVSLVIAVLCGAFLVADVDAAPKAKIMLKGYPDFKIGILANNFIKPLPLTKDNMKKVMDWTSANGFAWMEIRDPRADLTYAECKELARYAVSKKIEVIYALNIGFLDPQFNEVFYRGCANAALFPGPKVVRTSAPGPEFNADPKKSAWTAEEFDKLIGVANNAANVAKLLGLDLVLEHAYEAMQGDGVSSFGMVEIQTKGNTNIGSQYDTANFFAVSRAPVSPEAAKGYFEKFAKKTQYVHIKTCGKDNVVTDSITDNVLDLGVIFDVLAKAKVRYLGIEIPQQAKFDDVQANLRKSAAYLQSKY